MTLNIHQIFSHNFLNPLRFALVSLHDINKEQDLQQMFTTSHFVVIILLIVPAFQSSQCDQLIQAWLNDPQTLPPIVYTNSGKFLNDLGDYNNCLYYSQSYVYFTLSVVNKLAGTIQSIGMCAPRQCNEELESNKYAAKIQQNLNQAFKNATKSQFEPFVGLVFYNPVTNQPEMDWSNYLTIGFFLILISLGIIGSILSFTTQSKSFIIRIIKCFSFYDNIVKIVTIPKSHENQNLLFLNGAKVLSICWVIYGHDQWFRLAFIKNWTESLDILTTPGIPTLAPAAYFAVDTFFWIGGFLVTIGMLDQVKKIKKLSQFFIGSVLHRFIRIWPTYMVAILMFWKIAPFFGNGPVWRTFYTLSQSCNNGGVLWNMFFIDNFQDHGPNGMDYCFGWGWYLAVDFQLFLISPFIMYSYHKNKKFGWLLTFTLFLLSVIIAFILIMVNNWRYPIPNPNLPPQPDFMDNFYYKPYVRASAYLMGIFTGFIYVQFKAGNEAFVNPINKIKNSVLVRILFYVFGIIIVETVIWIIIPYQSGAQEWSTLAQAFYNSLNRVFFLIGVFMCCFSSIFGCNHDPTKYILGHWFFAPLAKVSFCMYLVHFIVIMNGLFSVRMDLFWQVESSLYTVITDIFLSVMLATCLTLLIESPVLGLEKILLRGGGKGKAKAEKKKENLKKSLINEEQSIESTLSEQTDLKQFTVTDSKKGKEEILI